VDLANERIIVTGGAGFLGKYLQAELLRRGAKRENLLVPLIEDYDLTKEADVVRMYDDMAPTVVIHLRPRSAASAPTARTQGDSSTPTWPWACTWSSMPAGAA